MNLFKRAAIFTDLHLGEKSNSVVHNEDCVRYIDWFIDLAKKLGIIEVRYMRIVDDFNGKEQKIISFIQKALLSKEAQQLYIKNLQYRLKRIR